MSAPLVYSCVRGCERAVNTAVVHMEAKCSRCGGAMVALITPEVKPEGAVPWTGPDVLKMPRGQPSPPTLTPPFITFRYDTEE